MFLKVAALVVALAGSTFLLVNLLNRKPKWDPKGKVRVSIFRDQKSPRVLSSFLQHCYVTGGSAGLGLALSILLVKRGAHVSIVARDKVKLDEALQQLEVCGV